MRLPFLACLAALIGSTSVLGQEEIIPQNVEMVPGIVRIYQAERPFRDIIIGRTEIADVATLTDQRIAITAFKEGVTSIVFLDENKQVISSALLTVAAGERLGKTVVSVREGHSQPLQYLCAPRTGALEGGGCNPSGSNRPPLRPVPVTILNINATPSATTQLPPTQTGGGPVVPQATLPPR